jgi:hypothetical protein
LPGPLRPHRAGDARVPLRLHEGSRGLPVLRVLLLLDAARAPGQGQRRDEAKGSPPHQEPAGAPEEDSRDLQDQEKVLDGVARGDRKYD